MRIEIKKKRKIVRLKEDARTSKLLAQGLVPGSMLEVIRKSPFGKVYYVQVDRQVFALRKEELDLIECE